MGTKFTTETGRQPDIGRIVKVADAKGRDHECILKIFIDSTDDDIPEFILESDSNQGKH
jgi:hypothetical protein